MLAVNEQEVTAPKGRFAAMGDSGAPTRGRILLVVYNFPFVSQTFIVDKFLHLLVRGWDVHISAYRTADHWWAAFPEVASQQELVDRVHLSDDACTDIWRLQPDIVHFEFGNLALGRLETCRRTGARSVVGFRGYDICYYGLERSNYYDEVWDGADVLHCRSEAIWQRCRQRGCPPDKPYRVVVGGIDLDFFDPVDRVHTEETGTRERPLRVLGVGRMVWKKGHEYSVQAVARLQQMGFHAELTIIGGGDYQDMIRFTAQDLGVLDRVTLLESQPRPVVQEAMRTADVLVMPSLSEGFGMAALEAQAMQLPVVCSDAEGLRENVQDMVTGFVVPRRNAELLAERLALLAPDPELRQAMGAAGRERVAHFFRVDQEVDGFERLYLDLLEYDPELAEVVQ